MKTVITLSIMVFIVLLPAVAMAFDGTPVIPEADGGDAPIDGGLSLLVAAGVGYGAKKLKAKKQRIVNV